ncbi:MAG: hypothetical protein ACOCRO_01335 [Halanaerobiales bacterium]
MLRINRCLILLSILFLLIFSFNALAQNDEENEERTFRNPFVEYVEPEPENNSNNNSNNDNNSNNSNNSENSNTAQRTEPAITFEDIKSELPFQLDGIISSGSKRIAIVDTGDGVEFVRSSFEKNNYKISAINQDSIIINNRGFTFQLKIGGEINER